MPRRPRIHIDGVPLHIVRCGHNREARFFDDQDRHVYAAIDAMTGQRPELRKHGRPRKKDETRGPVRTEQQLLLKDN